MTVEVRTFDTLVTVTLPVDIAIHADGDLLANPVEVPNAVKANGTTIVASVVVLNNDNQAVDMSVLFFDSDPGILGVKNAAILLNDAQMAKCQGSITVNSWDDLGTQQVGTETSTALVLKPINGRTSAWVALKSQGTGTYASGSLTVKLGLMRG